LQEAKVAKPIDETILPLAEGDAVSVRKTGRHSRAITHLLAGVTAVAINVQLQIRDTRLQHGFEVFVRPDRVPAISGACARDE
jgi:hypothetical protein